MHGLRIIKVELTPILAPLLHPIDDSTKVNGTTNKFIPIKQDVR